MARADEQRAARTVAVSILSPHTLVGSIPLLCRPPIPHHTPHSSCSVAHCTLWFGSQGAAFPNPKYLHKFLLMGNGASEFFCSEKQPAEHREMSSALLLQTTAPAPKKGRNGEDNPLMRGDLQRRIPVLLQEEGRLGGRDRRERHAGYIQVQKCLQAHTVGCLISFLLFSCKCEEKIHTALGQFRENVLQLVAT